MPLSSREIAWSTAPFLPLFMSRIHPDDGDDDEVHRSSFVVFVLSFLSRKTDFTRLQIGTILPMKNRN